MLGCLYLALLFVVGDITASFFFRPKDILERLAAAFLIGLVLCTWLTYLYAAVFPWPFEPLIGGNILFLLSACVLIAWKRYRSPGSFWGRMIRPDTADLVVIGLATLFAVWLMFVTFGYSNGEMYQSFKIQADLGANLSIVQSFALGSNFPTEYPLFAGDPIRNHFLFWFEAGNLYYLGLNPVWGVNLLSVLSLSSLLTMLIALGRRVFGDPWTGRIGALLFFFHGSLAYFNLVGTGTGIGDILARSEYLLSGYKYHGEDWGLWTLNVYVNQRHLISAIGIMVLVMVRWVDDVFGDRREGLTEAASGWLARLCSPRAAQLAFGGLLLGLMPMWNGPVFVASAAMFGLLLALFRDRLETVVLLAVACVTALPQILFLRPMQGSSEGSLEWSFGFNVDPPTLWNVLAYIGFIFGVKLVLMAVVLVLCKGKQRLLFIAILSTLVIAFTVKFSSEVLTNHKFINVWILLANLFVAYGAYRLWTSSMLGKAAAVISMLLIVPGGLIDIFPLKNDHYLFSKFDQEPLVEWIRENTDQHAVFLTAKLSNHPILYSGRKLYSGYTYFTEPAGYPVKERDKMYYRLLSTSDADQLRVLLKQEGIDYVVFEYHLRSEELKGRLNEAVYARNFPLVYESPDYGDIKIYKVSDAHDR